MRCFALTYPQLMNQAIAAGMVSESLDDLRVAHDVAEATSDGLYRAQGVPLLCHLVRTASIVLAEGQSPLAVSAALLHAVYLKHRFDGSRQPRCRRGELRRAVGAPLEALVWEYHRLPWYRAAALRAHLEAGPDPPARTRQLLVMRLANELEDRLDHALSYTGEERVERRGEGEALMAELAEGLGHPRLAAELREVFRDTAAFAPPGETVRQRRAGYGRSRPGPWARRGIPAGGRSWPWTSPGGSGRQR